MSETKPTYDPPGFYDVPRWVDGTLFDPQKGPASYGFDSYYPEIQRVTETWEDTTLCRRR